MEKMSGVDLHMESSEGGLKELVLKWFTETQALLILSPNGNFPDWFQGFAARKDTEDLLRDKALGCFLIRLSDKAIGYILSYKGLDRCRHFVITQNPDGQFVISGDCQTYSSLTELIEHYKVSPIQPFGEYLTSSCYEVNTGELYDVVNYNAKQKSGVSVQALRTLWDQKDDHHSAPGNNQRIQQQNDSPAAQPPALPAKSKSRKLTGAVSVDAVSLSQVIPPVPKRGIPLGFSLSGSLPETTSHPSETQTDPNRSQRLRGNTNPALMSDRDSFNTTDTSYPGDLCPPGITYSEPTQMESRSKSLPRLNNSNMEEEEDDEYSNQLGSPAFKTSTSYSPTPPKRVTCHTYSLHDPRDSPRPSSSWSEQQGGDVEMLKSNPLYHTADAPGGSSVQRGDGMYAEVPQRPTPAGLPDDTYEQIPGEAAVVQGNMYESLEDVKTKKSKSTWGKNNMKWKNFLPDYKKK
ncbi:SH2 domain-containing protein 7 [Perca fluviatilis]|uniref:SH2 domain-containing protein 7 n=1 Tax=Perca fluviatilis TaxID=8168 RepID=UPI001962A9C2|nr:SH2 domain-containing protein 7 [Perca fluviatilis]